MRKHLILLLGILSIVGAIGVHGQNPNSDDVAANPDREAIDLVADFLLRLKDDSPVTFAEEVKYLGFLGSNMGFPLYVNAGFFPRDREPTDFIKPLPAYGYLGELIRMNRDLFFLQDDKVNISYYYSSSFETTGPFIKGHSTRHDMNVFVVMKHNNPVKKEALSTKRKVIVFPIGVSQKSTIADKYAKDFSKTGFYIKAEGIILDGELFSGKVGLVGNKNSDKDAYDKLFSHMNDLAFSQSADSKDDPAQMK